MNQHLHIICSQVPWPADCSISKDSFFTIEAFYESGKKIHLHYFCSNEHRHPNELNRYCEKISLHKSGLNNKIFDQDEFPILAEGTRNIEKLTTIPGKRNVVIRVHSIPNERSGSSNFVKRLSFTKRKNGFPQEFPKEYIYACMDQHDVEECKRKFHLEKVIHIPAFISQKNICCAEGVGNFCLYYGDLSLPSSEKAVIWLLNNVFNDFKIPFVIAGKNPSERLNKLAHFYQHTCLIANPAPECLNDLIRKAQVIVMPSFDESVSSYNISESLYSCRHCITNETALSNNELQGLCHIAKDPGQFKSIIRKLFQKPLQQNEIEKRKQILGSVFNNERSVKQLSEHLW